MRTKTTLAAAAILAAGLASSMAQNVYSLNVVGYVNVDYKAGFNNAGNPLVGSPDNTINSVIKGTTIPDGAFVLKWNTTTGDFDSVPSVYAPGSSSWSPNVTLPQGLGYYLFTPSDFTQTYVGEVKQGTTTTQIVPGFNILSSPEPIAGAAAVVTTQMTPTEGDLVFKWNTASNPQDFFSTPAQYSSGSWTAVANGNFGVGEGFLYFSSASGNVNWNRNFTVQ